MHKNNTNVYEIGVEEGHVTSREERAIQIHAIPLVENFKRTLKESRVISLESFVMEVTTLSWMVLAVFIVKVGSDEVKIFAPVMRNGSWESHWESKLFSFKLNLNQFKLVHEIIRKIVPTLQGSLKSKYAEPENILSIKIVEHLRLALQPELFEAETRFEDEITLILENASVKTEANLFWENEVRKHVHGVLEGKGIELYPPDLVHRLIDEIYVKHIHES